MYKSLSFRLLLMKKWFKIVSSLFLIAIVTNIGIVTYSIVDSYKNPWVETLGYEDYLHEPLQNGIGYIQDGKIKVLTFDLSFEAFSEFERDSNGGKLSIKSMHILVVIFSHDPPYLDTHDCNVTYLVFNETITSVAEATIESNQYGYKTITGSNKDNFLVEKGEIVRFYLALKDLDKDEYVASLLQPNNGSPKDLNEIEFKPL